MKKKTKETQFGEVYSYKKMRNGYQSPNLKRNEIIFLKRKVRNRYKRYALEKK